MRSDITTILAFVVVGIWSTAEAQRGSTCPSLTPRTCDFSTPGRQFQEVPYPENATEITFKPTAPGKYAFQFRSYDLCTYAQLPAPVEVHARCPPAPTSVLKFDQDATATYFLEDTVTITSQGSMAHSTFQKNADMTYTFEIIEPNTRANEKVTPTYVLDANGVATVTYKPPRKGQYVVKLTVDDGCSSTESQRCFEVLCNCGPTANAGKTVTMWSNNVNAASGDNNAGIDDASLLQFTLDGSLSYDFDIFHRGVVEVLTYKWEFVSWEPASPLQFATHFTPACASRTAFNGIACNLARPTYNASAAYTHDASGAAKPVSGTRQEISYNADPYNKITSPANTWMYNTQVPATVDNVGYETTISPMGLGQAIEFRMLGRLLPQIQPDRETVDSRQAVETTETVPNEYPLWMPRYNNNPPMSGGEENFMEWAWNTGKPTNPTTTSCMAYVSKTETRVKSVRNVDVCDTVATPTKEPDMTFCRVQIKQSSNLAAQATVTFPHPDAENYPNYDKITPKIQKLTPTALPLASFEYCRGLFRFKLTVQDKCGVDTQSTDYIDVTVRCNSPPVAIAGCQTTVIYKPEYDSGDQKGFEQVTVDGRASTDMDNSQLTYYWSFLQYPEKHKTRGIGCKHIKCKQDYCQVDRYVKNPYLSDGGINTWGNASVVLADNDLRTDRLIGVTGYDDVCAPTVYPALWDLNSERPANCFRPSSGQQSSSDQNMCLYSKVDATRGHLGNSAYFTPNAPGTYVIQLAVFDGCSTAIDIVTVKANCPTIEFLPAGGATYTGITLSGQNNQLATGVVPSVTLTTTPGTAPKFESQDPNYLQKVTYQWKYQKFVAGSATGTQCSCAAGSSNCCVFSNPNDASTTTFTAGEAGTYRFSLQVTDGCQDPIESGLSAAFVVTCNTPPVFGSPPLEVTPATRGASVLFDSDSGQYPQVTLTAKASGPENTDQMSYQWEVTEVNAGASSSVSSSVEQTRPNVNNAVNRNDKLIIRPNVVRSGGNLGIKDGAKTFSIAATAFDGCSSVRSTAQQIVFACEGDLTLTATPNGAQLEALQYDFAPASEGFNSLTFDASASTSKYTGRVGNQILYTWSVTGGRGSANAGNDPVAVQAQNQPRLTWRPSASVLDTYTIKLTIEDGCSTGDTAKTREWSVSTRCPSTPTASLVPSATTVFWNSFGGSNSNTGGFPPLSLDASGSTNAQGASTLAYDLRLMEPIARAQQIPTTSGKATYAAPEAGRYTFALKVSNGPCDSQDMQTVVQFSCLPIVPRMTTLGSTQVSTGVLQVPQATWNGVRFPTVCLDGRQLQYGNQGTRGSAGAGENYNSLKYTWTVVRSPQDLPACTCVSGCVETPSCGSSMYGISATVSTSQPAGALDQLPLQGLVLTDQPSRTNSTHSVKCGKATREQTTTTVVTSTELFNHHYNLPLTCFVPDKKGQYTVSLKVDDGCSAETMTAEVTTGCPAPIQLAPAGIQISPASPLVLDGTQFRRVTLDARQSLQPRDIGRDTLTYRWQIVEKPSGSMTALTNPHGNIASIVPDLKGNYKVSITVMDGCNPPQTTEVSVIVSCNAALVEVQSADVKVGYPLAMATATGVPEIEWKTSKSTNNNPFQDQQFTLTGRSGTACSVKKRQWFLISRECTDAYVPGAAPPPVAVVSQCKVQYECEWILSKIPCHSSYKTDANLRPVSRQDDTISKDLEECPNNGVAPSDRIDACKLLRVQPSREDQCLTRFQCKQPGTYELTLTVSDGCTEDQKKLTVSCRCETRIQATVNPFWSSMYVCDSGTNRFQTVQLKAEVASLAERGGLPLEACRSKPPAPTPAVTPTDSCCPAQPPCPACPTCPTCPDMCTPQCPTAGRAGSARVARDQASAPMKTRRRAFLAKEASSDKITFSHVMGVTIPLSAVMVLTLLGNVILHLRIKSCEAKAI